MNTCQHIVFRRPLTEENSGVGQRITVHHEVLPQPHSCQQNGRSKVQVYSMDVILPMVEGIAPVSPIDPFREVLEEAFG
eukprot:Skav236633  [mRNA]  locus=scaffold2276:150247:151424:+ [translate_table: standard]